MAAARFYSSTSGAMNLTADITAADTSITVDSVAGLPGTRPFALVLDPGTASEEIVDVTNASGTTLTVTRGVDGSSAQAHAAGVGNVRHMATARDFREPQEHIAASSGVHGLTGSVVGTSDVQTLTNKTLGATAFTGAITGSQDATLGAASATSVTSTGAVNVNVGTAVSGVTVKQGAGPTVPAVDVYEDATLGTTKARVKLSPGATNVVEITGNDYAYLTGGSAVVTKDGRVTITGSNGVGSPADPILALVNSNPSGGDTLSMKDSAGTVVAKFDKDGKLTTPQVTSTGDVSGTTGTFSGALSSPTITTLTAADAALDTRLDALETTAWTSVALASGMTGTMEYRVRGKTVDLRGDVVGTLGAGFTQINSGTLPAAARPGFTPARTPAYVNSGTTMGTVEVTTGGVVNAQCDASRPRTSFNFSYPAA